MLQLIFSIVIGNLGKAWIKTNKGLSSWKRILSDLWSLCLNKHFFYCIANENESKDDFYSAQQVLDIQIWAEKPGQEQSYPDVPDTSLELITFSILLIEKSDWYLPGRWDKNILMRNFQMFPEELAAEAADGNRASKGSALIKPHPSLTAFSKAANYNKLLFFIGSSELLTVKPSSLSVKRIYMAF